MPLFDRIKPISYLMAHAAEFIRTLASGPAGARDRCRSGATGGQSQCATSGAPSGRLMPVTVRLTDDAARDLEVQMRSMTRTRPSTTMWLQGADTSSI